MNSFRRRLEAVQRNNSTLLCVGLDPDPRRFPSPFAKSADSIRDFNRAIIAATADLACAYKPNLGFYLPHGPKGIEALIGLREDVPDDIPLILDNKVGDISSTSESYARGYFENWNFDAVTAHPYMGHESLKPLLKYPDKAVFILSKTSNPNSGVLQDQAILTGDATRSTTVSDLVAQLAVSWNEHGNVGLVVGATYPRDLRRIRRIAPDLIFLVPGVGAQEGNLQSAVRAGLDERGAGLFINSSRAISYASSGVDFQDAARAVAMRLRDEINAARMPVEA